MNIKKILGIEKWTFGKRKYWVFGLGSKDYQIFDCFNNRFLDVEEKESIFLMKEMSK
jgi:hypothetical protein